MARRCEQVIGHGTPSLESLPGESRARSTNPAPRRMDEIAGGHFLQLREAAWLRGTLTRDALEMMADRADQALDEVQRALPASFPEQIHTSLKAGLAERLKRPEFL